MLARSMFLGNTLAQLARPNPLRLRPPSVRFEALAHGCAIPRARRSVDHLQSTRRVHDVLTRRVHGRQSRSRTCYGRIHGGSARLAWVIYCTIATSACLLKLLSLVAPLQSRFSTSELDSPNRHRQENIFNLQRGRAARVPPLNRSLDVPTSCSTHTHADCGDGPPQAPLTVCTT